MKLHVRHRNTRNIIGNATRQSSSMTAQTRPLTEQNGIDDTVEQGYTLLERKRERKNKINTFTLRLIETKMKAIIQNQAIAKHIRRDTE